MVRGGHRVPIITRQGNSSRDISPITSVRDGADPDVTTPKRRSRSFDLE